MTTVLLDKKHRAKEAARRFLNRWKKSPEMSNSNFSYHSAAVINDYINNDGTSIFETNTITGKSFKLKNHGTKLDRFFELATLEKHKKSFNINHIIYRQIQQKDVNENILLVPQLYKPLPILSTIRPKKMRRDKESKVELPTIYLMADPSEVTLMHELKPEKNKLVAKMLYNSSSVIQVFDHVDIQIAEKMTDILQKMRYDIQIRGSSSLNGSRRLKLYSFGYDLSQLPEKIKYRMLASMKMPTTTLFTYVRIFINNRPIGIFGLIDDSSVIAPWLQNEFVYFVRNPFYRVQEIKSLDEFKFKQDDEEEYQSAEEPIDTTMQISQYINKENVFIIKDLMNEHRPAALYTSTTRQTPNSDNMKNSIIDYTMTTDPSNFQDTVDWDPFGIIDSWIIDFLEV